MATKQVGTSEYELNRKAQIDREDLDRQLRMVDKLEHRLQQIRDRINLEKSKIRGGRAT
jgi:hypothetical protein